MQKFELRDKLCNEIQYLYENIGRTVLTFDEFLKRKHAFYRKVALLVESKKLRQYHYEYISGYDRCLWNDLLQNKLEFGYYLGGIFYSVWSAKNTAFEHTTRDLEPMRLHYAYTARIAVSMSVLRGSKRVWQCDSVKSLEKLQVK